MKMLSSVVEDTFGYPPCRQAYLRIMKTFRTKTKLMEMYELVHDLQLEVDYREIIANSDVEPCASKTQIEKLLHTLDNYRKLRLLYEACKSGLDALKKDKINIDKLLNDTANSLAKARSKSDLENDMIIMGKGSNSSELIRKILFEDRDPLLKTGFKMYDDVNGGLPRCGVMIVAATTSGGKSVMLMNLSKQIHMLNQVDVCRVSLEMSVDQEINRLASNLSAIEFKKFRRGLLSDKEKHAAAKKIRMFEDASAANGTRHVVICPTYAVSMDDILMTLKPYRFDVIGIDYISLLEGVDSDNQWRVMGNITAQAKRYSRETKSLVIILAQLDEASEKVRYSKAIKENADVVWTWSYEANSEARASRQAEIAVSKERDGDRFKFPLGERFDVMRFENVEGTIKGFDDEEAPMNSNSNYDEEADKMLNMTKNSGVS